MTAVVALAGILAQSAPPPDTSGSDPAILVVGVLLVTAVIGIVVARRAKR